MYKILRIEKDTYITDRVVSRTRKFNANLGSAGTLDLFKLYGVSKSGSLNNLETSRLLVKFDLDPIRQMMSDGSIDINHSSFNVKIKLFDVYGGQPNPSNFTVMVNPLSKSFDEGIGRDVVYYGDYDVANFLTASRTDNLWVMSGANSGGAVGGNHDYCTTHGSANLTATQFFTTGTEDLFVDVTTAVSATLAGNVPDHGFRIALTSSHENDQYNYFVKRFASRNAYNVDKRGQMIVIFDDSVIDDTQIAKFDQVNTFFLYNYENSAAANILSGSSQITGQDCMKLRFEYLNATYYFTASQHRVGSTDQVGIYSASIKISSLDPAIKNHLAYSGSIKFTPIWYSLDNSIPYVTGSAITLYPKNIGGERLEPKRYVINVHNLQTTLRPDEVTYARVTIFDYTEPRIKAVRTPIEMPGLVVRNAYYSIRDAVTNEAVVPFETTYGGTKLSSDSTGMYFKLDCNNLLDGRSYVVDIKLITGGNEQIYKNASPIFKVTSQGG